MWRGIVEKKYGIMEGGWRTRNITTPFGVDYGGVLCRDEKTSVVIFFLKLGMGARLTFGHINDAGRAS